MKKLYILGGCIILLYFPYKLEKIYNNLNRINKKSVSSDALENNIDLIEQKKREEDHLHNTYNALNVLTNKDNNDKYHVQGIINLLDAELIILSSLKEGKTGFFIDEALGSRNQLLTRSTPLTIRIYNTIMNAITYNPAVHSKLSKVQKKGRGLSAVMGQQDKKIFLGTMSDKLKHYRKMLYAKLADGSQNHCGVLSAKKLFLLDDFFN